MGNIHRLKQFLSRYNSWNCPDKFYLAWLVLIDKRKEANSEEILNDALHELEDLENSKSQSNFEKGRYKGKDILTKRKYNW